MTAFHDNVWFPVTPEDPLVAAERNLIEAAIAYVDDESHTLLWDAAHEVIRLRAVLQKGSETP